MTQANRPDFTSAAFDAMLYQAECLELTELAGAHVRIERDDDAPMPWAVWCKTPCGEEDIIGGGESGSEAIEEARATIRGWA